MILDLLALQGQRALVDPAVQQERQAHRVPQVPTGHLVLQGRPVPPDLLVPAELLDLREQILL